MTEDHVGMAAPDQLSWACERVGRFLYHFALLEQAIGEGVAKLLGLDTTQTSVVMANLDFTRKVNILFAGEAQAAAPHGPARKKEVDATYSTIMRLNNHRVVLAHSSFKPIKGDRVRFDRITAKKRLQAAGEIWTAADFEGHYTTMTETALAIDRFVVEMEPYSPSLDLSDPRNVGLALAIIL